MGSQSQDRLRAHSRDLANRLAMHDNMGMVCKHLLRQASCSALLCAAGFIFVASSSFAQKTLVQKTDALVRNTDININIYGAFPMTATGNVPLDSTTGQPVPGATALKQSADPAPGFRIGGRHIFSPILGLEINFGYNPATQHFSGATPTQNGPVYSHAKPLTFDYVVTMPHLFHGFQPFALGGAGLISYNISSYVQSPPGSPSLAVKPIKIPVGEYGVGADYHPSQFPAILSMRFQYRGLVGHAPGYRNPLLATNNVINIAEPQVGLVFKF